MISALKIRRFRGFKSLELHGLKRVNLVVGASASGKTALLEAIRLTLGATPAVAFQLNSYRGMGFGFPAPLPRELFEAAWSPFFYDFDIKTPIEFSVMDDVGREASLRMYFDTDTPVTATFPSVSTPGAAPLTIAPLVFSRKGFDGETSKLSITILPQTGQIQFEAGPELGRSQEFFASNLFANSVQVANWYSQASTANQEQEIVAEVNKEFPSITDLSVQAPPGQVPSLYATVKNRSRKLPLSLVSSGITKFVATVTAVRQFHDGVVLVDEIENGIYYAKLGALLTALHRIAVSANTQLFLTTHSIEFLRAATSVIDKAPDDFSLVQVFQENGGSRGLVIPGGRAAAAIENDIEIRKP